MSNFENRLKKILADFVTGDIAEMPIEQIKRAVVESGEYVKVEDADSQK